MEYCSVREIAGRWGVSMRYVQRLLQKGRISAARKLGKSWMIPSDAQKPQVYHRLGKESLSCPPCIYIPSTPILKNTQNVIMKSMPASLHKLMEADLSYRRGDPYPAIGIWKSTPVHDETKLTTAFLATVATICSGEYELYYEIQHCLSRWSAKTENPTERALFELPRTLAIVSMAAPTMTPTWLKEADFSLFPSELKQFLLFLYTLHLRNIREYSEVRATARSAYELCANANTFTWLDINFLLLGATSSYHLHETGQALKFLKIALDLGMPCGFIMPFADCMGDLGGMMGDCLRQSYPDKIKQITELWNTSFKNWMLFHNEFTKENITTLLTIQEYQVARLICGGATYAETARRMYLSVSRIKDLISSVYGKLYINDRRELSHFIL